MNQTSDHNLTTLSSCLECTEADSWIYSYEESLTKLFEETSRPVHITDKLDAESLSPHQVATRLEHHSLLIEGNQIEASQYGQLLDIKIVRFGQEQRIVLWNIKPEEVSSLILEISKALKPNN